MANILYVLTAVFGIHPQACKFLRLDHHLHSSFEISIIERTIQYIKDRTESFDDYFPCRKNKCRLEHVMHWLNLFVDMHNEMIFREGLNEQSPLRDYVRGIREPKNT